MGGAGQFGLLSLGELHCLGLSPISAAYAAMLVFGRHAASACVLIQPTRRTPAVVLSSCEPNAFIAVSVHDPGLLYVPAQYAKPAETAYQRQVRLAQGAPAIAPARCSHVRSATSEEARYADTGDDADLQGGHRRAQSGPACSQRRHAGRTAIGCGILRRAPRHHDGRLIRTVLYISTQRR